jgi:glycosyltransferase involved in cell wall biosynthesis
MYKVALVQCICPHYRVPFFKALAEQVDLCLFYGKGERKGSWRNASRIEGFTHHRLASLRLRFRLKEFTVRLVWFPSLVFRLKKLRPDVIISEGLTNILNNIRIWLFCRSAGVPWIVWDSGRKKGKPMGALRRCVEFLNIFLLKRANAVLAYGSVAREYFISLGVCPEAIFTARNTLDVGACMQDARRLKADPAPVREAGKRLGLDSGRTVLYVGALEKRKEIHTLINAFAVLQREVPFSNLLIVGDGGYKKTLARMAAKAHIENCRFTGRITEGAGALFALADVLVLPGQGGLAVNQAMAYGLPVVVGRGDGTEVDLVKNGLNGFLVKDTADIVQALRTLLADHELSKSMGCAGRKIIGKYTLEQMTHEFKAAILFVTRQEKVP